MLAPSNRTSSNQPLYKWFILYLSLSATLKGVVAGVFLVFVLFAFSVITSAVCELATTVHQLYASSDGLTRLIILVIAVYIVRKSYLLVFRIVKGI